MDTIIIAQFEHFVCWDFSWLLHCHFKIVSSLCLWNSKVELYSLITVEGIDLLGNMADNLGDWQLLVLLLVEKEDGRVWYQEWHEYFIVELVVTDLYVRSIHYLHWFITCCLGLLSYFRNRNLEVFCYFMNLDIHQVIIRLLAACVSWAGIRKDVFILWNKAKYHWAAVCLVENLVCSLLNC